MELAQNIDSPGNLMVIHYIAEAVNPLAAGGTYMSFYRWLREGHICPSRRHERKVTSPFHFQWILYHFYSIFTI